VRHATHVERIARSFGGRVLRVGDRDGTNSVVFAARGGALAPAGGALRRPANLSAAGWTELRGAFSRVSHALAQARQDGGAPDAAVSDEPG